MKDGEEKWREEDEGEKGVKMIKVRKIRVRMRDHEADLD